MTIAEALDFFSAVPNVRTKLQTLNDVGLGLRPPRPAGDDAVGRRGPAGQALDRAVAPGDRPDPLRPRRADDRAPLRRRREAARGPPSAGRRRQHGPRHRAQPRRHQDRGLDRRPRAGGRRPRRPDHRRGHAREGRDAAGSATGEYLARVLRGEPLVPLSDVTFAEEAGRAIRSATATARTPVASDRAVAQAGAGGQGPLNRRVRRDSRRSTAPARRRSSIRMPDIDFAFLADAAETVPGQKFHVLGGGIARIGGRRFPLAPPAPRPRHRPPGDGARDRARARDPVRPARPRRRRGGRRDRQPRRAQPARRPRRRP